MTSLSCSHEPPPPPPRLLAVFPSQKSSAAFPSSSRSRSGRLPLKFAGPSRRCRRAEPVVTVCLPIDFLRVRCPTVAVISSPSPSHAELGSARSVPASGAHKHAVTKSPPSHCSLSYQACMTGGSLCLIFLYVVHCQSGLQLFLEAQTKGSDIDQPVSQSTINK